jgi:hypothetical protein
VFSFFNYNDMKQKIIGIVFVAAIVVAAAWNFSQNKVDAELSDLALANVEALAGGEITIGGCCSNGVICVVTIGETQFVYPGSSPCSA